MTQRGPDKSDEASAQPAPPEPAKKTVEELLNPPLYRIFDAYLGSPQKDWSGEVLKRITTMMEQGKAAQMKAEADRVTGTRPSLPVENYAGTFKNDLYGDVQVTNSGGTLNLRFGPAFVSNLEHWHYDTFRAKFSNAVVPGASMTFALNAQGKVDTLTLNMPGMTDYPFKRASGSANVTVAGASTAMDLRKFAGKWALAEPPLEVSTEIVGNDLKLLIPGQPAYTLVLESENKFAIKEAPAGYFALFNVTDGKIKSLTMIQDTASYTLMPKP